MKLVNPDYNNQIKIKEDRVNVVVIENPSLFYDYVADINNQCNGMEGRCVLSEQDTILPFDKNAHIIINPLDMDLNNRKIISKLYTEMKEIALDENLYIHTSELVAGIMSYITEIADESDYSLDYDHEIDITNIFKLVNLKIAKQGTSLLEMLLEYMDIMQRMMKVKLCICVNLKSYLDETDFEKLYSMLNYKKINILLIENHVPENKLEAECIYVIDKDGCEIY